MKSAFVTPSVPDLANLTSMIKLLILIFKCLFTVTCANSDERF